MEMSEEELQAKIAFAREKQRLLREELKQKLGESGYERFVSYGVVDTTPKVAPIADEQPVRCPRCRSSQLTANPKGYGVGKAAVGVLLAGPIGLLGGFVGSSKIRITCLACGYQWRP